MQNLNKQMRAFYAWQEQHSLSTVAIALYYTLLNHAGKCNSMEFSVAISTLSKHTGMSERSVFRARELLSNHNLIHIEQTAYRDCARYTIHSLLYYKITIFYIFWCKLLITIYVTIDEL